VAGALTILHISDIHLQRGRFTPHFLIPGAHRARREVADALREELRWQIEAARKRGDEVLAVLSGDLSLLGDDRDVRYALAWWEAVTTATTATYVLGNHDYWGGSVIRRLTAAPLVQLGIRQRHWPHEVPPIDLDDLRVRVYLLDTTPDDIVRNTAVVPSGADAVMTSTRVGSGAAGFKPIETLPACRLFAVQP
jgi:predicted MPP superfamily phosphohydrolase